MRVTDARGESRPAGARQSDDAGKRVEPVTTMRVHPVAIAVAHGLRRPGMRLELVDEMTVMLVNDR